jgi:PAS domain S-box-containing protein
MSSRLSELPQEQESSSPRRRGVTALLRSITPRVAYAVIALLLAALCVVAARYYSSVKSELTDMVLARRAAVAQLAAATLSERLDRVVDLGVSLATRVRFAELVAAGQWDAAVQIMKSVPAEFRFVDRVVLADVRGTVMADIPDLKVRGQNFAHRDWYQGVSREWRPYVSGVYRRSAAPQRSVFAVAVPVVDRNGAPSGILHLQVQLETFFDWATAIDLGAGGAVYIVDAKGAVAFDSRSPSRAEIADFSEHPAVARLLRGASGVEVVGEYVYAFMPGRHGWDVVVEQPAAQAFAARDAQLRFVQLAYALTALFLLAAAWLGVVELKATRRSLARHAERLRMLHEIDRAVLAEQTPEAIAAAVIRPLRELLGVSRAIVNKFDLAAGEAEWIAAAGRRRVHVGPGVRYSIRLMGDVEALRRGDTQLVDVHALPPGPETAALLASGVHVYMVVPMSAGGELLGAISFGGRSRTFPQEQVNIVREVAAQLAIAISQARLLARTREHAAELESRVRERTAALDALNQELEDLYNNAPCGYHSVGKDGVFVRMNDTELKWLGYTREEVIGKMGPRDLHTPESLKLFLQRFEQFKQSGEARDVEYEFRRKDGSVLPVVLNATAVRDRDGNFVMSRSTIFDNTERKRAQQATRESEQEMRMLHAATLEISKAEDSTEALAILLRKLCEYSGWSFAQSWLPYAGTTRLKLGPAWYSRVAGLEAFRERNERLAFAPEGGALERVSRTKVPDWIWELKPAAKAVRRPLMIDAGLKSWVGFPVLADGEVIAVIEFFDTELRSRDERMLRLISILATQLGPVIQRKRIAEQIEALNANLQRYTVELEATNKELESFTYSVSHDLRSPLRAVDGYARMLEEDYAGGLDDEGRRLLGVVRSSSRQMGQLIDDLLAFSRLGRQELFKREVDMHALAREVVDELARGSSARVELGLLPSVQADRALLKQAWANLVGNALKYSGKRQGARIEIGGREEQAENVYWVRDNGVGFDMRYADKLFGVFQRLHGQDAFPGTGVGLAIVQRVITRHGGRVWAEGRPGEGACFYFSLLRTT